MPVSRAPAVHPRRRLEVFLVRPTKYDDDGYLLRHLRNVLPSNSLACLHALTEEAAGGASLREVEVRSHLCDESVQALPERRLRRAARRRDTKVVLCLVGVQTSQFPRASDIARRFCGGGIAVLIGGFHVSGRAISAPELRVLADAGVTLVRGEVEGRWASILADAAHGSLAPVYDFLDAKPDLSHAPVPRLDAALERKFVYRHFGTIDTSRGCPFSCSFCAIIQIQGRRMRGRDPGAIAAAIEANHREIGTHHYFFTDDDFARNGAWPRIFDEIGRLRRERGIPIRFLMQVDALAHRIPGFVAAARRAGCFQVFIGLESLNPDSLRDANKKQLPIFNSATGTRGSTFA